MDISPVQRRIMDSPVVSTDHSLRRKLALSPVGITLKSEPLKCIWKILLCIKGHCAGSEGTLLRSGVSFHGRQCMLCCLLGVSLHAVGAGGIAYCV